MTGKGDGVVPVEGANGVVEGRGCLGAGVEARKTGEQGEGGGCRELEGKEEGEASDQVDLRWGSSQGRR